MHDQSLGKPEVLEDAQETQCRVIDAGGARRTGLVDRPPSITVIPDEILREILIEGYNYSVTPILVHGKEHEEDPTKYLLAISQTCNWFRNISLSCTSLWVGVHLEWPPRRRQLWVQRSGTRELEVHMHSSKKPLIREIPYTQGDVFDKFYEWRTLCAYDVTPHSIELVLGTALAGPAVEWQSLQSINITQPPSSFINLLSKVLLPANSPIREGGSFPNLREITLSGALYDLRGMLDHVVTLDIHRVDYVTSYY